MQEHWIGTVDDATKENILIDFPTVRNTTSHINKQTKLVASKYNLVTYRHSLRKVRREIINGNTFLCNLTISTPIQINTNLQHVFNEATAKYKLQYKKWVCFSPEIFVQIQNNTISTNPMKGTIDALKTNAEHQILNDNKEIAEHYTIVDLLRNDLNIVGTNVQVEKFRYIDTITSNSKKLLQVSSKITASLTPDWHSNIGTIIHQLLPAGSITGAPKQKTLEIIKDAELHERGFYTGIAGYYDGNTLDSCVLIRFIEEVEKDQYVYKSGGGITCNSSALAEWKETQEKIFIPTNGIV